MTDAERISLAFCVHPDAELDGSLASMWTVETVLHAVRRAPELATEVPWLPTYLADFAERAFTEMGCQVTRIGDVVACTGPFPYVVNTRDVAKRLMAPPPHYPSFFGQTFTSLPVLGRCLTTMWALPTVFFNHADAQTQHDLIGHQRDRMDLAFPWIRDEQVRVARLAPEHLELGSRLIETMIWPPLGYAANDHGEQNLRRVRPLLAEVTPDHSPALRTLMRHPDRAIGVLAGAYALELELLPLTATEASRMVDAARVCNLRVSPARKALLHRATLHPPSVSEGATVDMISAIRSLDRLPSSAAYAALAVLCAEQPGIAAYTTALGWTCEREGHPDRAIAHYTTAIAQDPGFFQAYINRGVVHSQAKRFRRAADDFVAARRIWPDSPDVANNLVLNLLFGKKSERN